MKSFTKYPQPLKTNIFLSGFMGSGKSTIGKILAKELSKEFYDLDSVIEDFVGMSVDKIIEKFGFAYFRKVENQKLAYLSSKKNSVISLGGGSLINKTNIAQVKKTGILIYLMASEKTLLQRLEKSYKRPLMKVLQKEGFEKLFSERSEGYLSCDVSVNTDSLSSDEVSQFILREVNSDAKGV